MRVEIIKCLSDNYSYLVIDEKNNSCCVIDPSESKPIIEFLSKNKINLKFILNTHHHQDHIGGNIELKKLYGSKVIGFYNDRKRIPGLDIGLRDRDVWQELNFKARILHTPGHTSGHICFNFFDQKLLFCGDTLFSLGCGRIFEGTYTEMFNSLKLIKSLPIETKIYCGHEYTKNNFDFCISLDDKNDILKKKLNFINTKLNNSLPTIPSSLKEELETNIFLRCNNSYLKKKLGLSEATDEEIFKKLRDLKDSF